MNHAISNLFSDHLVTALSRTLIHSLWQGALLSIAIGLIMTFTRRSSSAWRYNLLVAVMALFAVVVAGTFMFEFNNGEARVPVAADQYIVSSKPVLAERAMHTPAFSFSIFEKICSQLNRCAATIVLIWFLIVCALRAAIGWPARCVLPAPKRYIQHRQLLGAACTAAM